MLMYFYLLLFLHITEGCRLEGAGETKPITAYTGGSVLLPCSCTDLHTTSVTFTWKKYINDWVEISPESDQYKDRFRLVNDHSSGNLSLLISHLTVEDGGDYMCSVTGGETRYFRLTVEGCRLNQQTVNVIGHVGQSVLLPCSCSQLQAKPHTLRWMFLKGYDHKEIFPKDQTKRYTHRVQLFSDHPPGNLSLLISHLTKMDGGWYRCQISNNDFKDISVTVKDATIRPSTPQTPKTKATSTPVLMDVTPTKPTLVVDDKMNTHSGTSGKGDKDHRIIISSGVAVVLLLLLILGGVMYWKRKGPRQRQPKIVEGQTGPNTQQKEQDFPEPSEPMYEAVDRQNDSEILYASILKKTSHKEADEK
ncbi:polymeric immunoglobulin receptor-like, partial [Clarias magur]